MTPSVTPSDASQAATAAAWDASAGRLSMGSGSGQVAGFSSRESAAAITAKSSVPVCHGQADEDFDTIDGRRVSDRGRDAARTVGRIERGGINGGVEKRHLGQ